MQGHLITYINQLILQLCELSNQTNFEQNLFKMVCTKQTEEKKQTIDRLKQRIGMDLATMFMNYGLTTDIRDMLMDRMQWTATECLEWDEQQEKERGKAPKKAIEAKVYPEKSAIDGWCEETNLSKARCHCIERNMKIPEIDQTSYQVSCLCQTGPRNCTRFQDGSTFSAQSTDNAPGSC